MGLFGGDSSSTSTSVTNNVDRRIANEGGLSITGDGVNASLTVTDHGSIAATLGVLERTGANQQETLKAVISAAGTFAADAMAQAATVQADAIAASRAAQSEAIGAVTSTARDAIDLSDRSQGRMYDTVADALGFTQHITDLAFENNQSVLGQAIQLTGTAYQTAHEQQALAANPELRYLMYAALAVVGVVGFMAVFK